MPARPVPSARQRHGPRPWPARPFWNVAQRHRPLLRRHPLLRATVDPINTARREDDEANLLVEAAFGDPDELERINGVGPMLCELLHEIGVFYFWQVAEWSPQDVNWVDDKLMHFKGRIQRDKWVDQAQSLAALPEAARRPGS